MTSKEKQERDMSLFMLKAITRQEHKVTTFKDDVDKLLRQLMTHVNWRLPYRYIIYQETPTSKNLVCMFIDENDNETFDKYCEQMENTAQIHNSRRAAQGPNGETLFEFQMFGVYLFNKSTQTQGALMYSLKDNGEQTLLHYTDDITKPIV